MRVGVRLVEIADQFDLPSDLKDYDGALIYCTRQGQVESYTTVWNSYKPLDEQGVQYPANYGSWLMLNSTLFSPLGAPPIDRNVIKGLLCAKAGISSEVPNQTETPAIAAPACRLSASLVVIGGRHPAELDSTLQILLKHPTRVIFEIIVVDTHPIGNQTAKIVAQYPQVRYVSSACDGLAGALNAGAVVARGEIVIAITEQLVSLEKNWLDHVVAEFARPEVTAVIGLTLANELELSPQEWLALDEKKIPLLSNTTQELSIEELNNPKTKMLERTGNFAIAAFRYEVFINLQVGPFEAESKKNGTPAIVEQLHRVVKSGGTVVYQPQVWALYRVSSSGKKITPHLPQFKLTNLLNKKPHSSGQILLDFAENLERREPLGQESASTDQTARAGLKQTNPLHICFVTTEYPPESNFGGIATFAYNATVALAQRGHKVSVVSIIREEKNTAAVREGVYIWRYSEMEHRATIRANLVRDWQVWQAINKLQPDVVHVFDYEAEGFLLSLLTSFARKRFRLVTYMLDHATLTNARRDYPFNFRRELLSFLARQQVLRSQAKLSPSYRLARQIERDSRLVPGSIRQIVQGLDLSKMAIYAETPPCIQIDDPYIIYYGRLEERKGLVYLAEALPIVLERFPGLKVVFAGYHSIYTLKGVPSKEFIEQAAGKYVDNLIFTNYLPREQVLPLVARAKLAVLPSIWEPYAYTCMESLALGVPVVTTGDSGGNAEIVNGLDDSDATPDTVPAGWLVPRKNSKALAAGIIEALSDEAELAIRAERALRRAHRFDVERVAGELEAVYREVLKTG
jgi:glycosyltransferase involved in cell wall biosynthesis